MNSQPLNRRYIYHGWQRRPTDKRFRPQVHPWVRPAIRGYSRVIQIRFELHGDAYSSDRTVPGIRFLLNSWR